MTALAAAVSRRPRWEYDPAADQAQLAPGGIDDRDWPIGPWALVTPERDGSFFWVAQQLPGAVKTLRGSTSDPDAALDAAERAVDAAVVR